MMKRSKTTEARKEQAIQEKSELLKDLETSAPLALSPLAFHKEVLLEAAALSLSYGDKIVCPPLSFTLRQGDRLLLTGKNGAGKSSLLKLILGGQISHTGTLRLASGLIFSYLPQDTGFLSGSMRAYIDAHKLPESLFKAILRKLDFSRTQFDKDLSALSDGQKKKILLAKSLCERAHIYLWDEPLNYVDVLSRIQIEELLLAFRPTMLFVEHDAAFQKKIATGHIFL